MKLGSDPSSSGGHSHERGGGNVVWKLYILEILGVHSSGFRAVKRTKN